jgi:hypothetical protein
MSSFRHYLKKILLGITFLVRFPDDSHLLSFIAPPARNTLFGGAVSIIAAKTDYGGWSSSKNEASVFSLI